MTRVAVVLGAALTPEGRPAPALVRRLEAASRLYEAGEADRLIVTGGSPGPSPVTEAAAMRAALEAAGVPLEAIREEPRARNTLENAVFSIPLVRAEGAERALLVTDAWHMPRARLVFRILGLPCEAVAVPSAPSRLRAVKEAAAIPFHGLLALVRRLRRGPL